jgi:nucleotide-binding universal stress UspA family protein
MTTSLLASDGPSLICYDGSEGAKRALGLAAELLVARPAVVLTVWQPLDVVGGIDWAGGSRGAINFAEFDRAAADEAVFLANDGVLAAGEKGLNAKAMAIQASGSVWSTICEVADRDHAAVIVMGSRGLSGVKSVLMGSVSSAVLHHAAQPALVIHPETDDR